MVLKRLVDKVARKRSGIVVLTGVANVLSGVERILSTRPRVKTPAAAIPRMKREHYFTIRQTRSELGYVYWVLQGFGCYQSFTLFDTWREAMDEAEHRIEIGKHAAEERPEFVLA